MTIITRPTGPTSSSTIDAEDVDYEEITDSEEYGDPLYPSGKKKADRKLPKLPSIGGWRVVLFVFLAILGAGIINNKFFGDASKVSASHQQSISVSPGNMLVKINGEDTEVVPGEPVLISVFGKKPAVPTISVNEASYPKNFVSFSNDPTIVKETVNGKRLQEGTAENVVSQNIYYLWKENGQMGQIIVTFYKKNPYETK